MKIVSSLQQCELVQMEMKKMHIYSHEELTNKLVFAQQEKIRLAEKVKELERELNFLRAKAAKDFETIEDLRKQRNDFCDVVKNHEEYLY